MIRPYTADQPVDDFGLVAPSVIYTAILGAAGSDDFAVPLSAPRWKAVFSYTPGVDVWVSINGTAAVPAGATFAVAASELNPKCREVAAGDTIDCFAVTANTNVSVSFYALNTPN